ncbi:unnamed protein product [Ixodes pacificus]
MPRVKLSDQERRERRRLAEQARRAAKRTSMTEDQRRERRRQAQRVRRADERAARTSRITTEDQRREQRRQAQKARRAAQREARDSAILQERAQPMAEPPAAAVPFATPSGNPLQGVASNQHPPPASKRPRAVLTGQPHVLQPCEDIEEADGEESICLLRFSKDFHFRCCSCAFATSGRWSITTHLLAYAAGLGCQIWKETSNPTKTVDDSWFSCCFCGHASGDQRAIIGHLIAHSADRLTILAPALRGPLFQGARLESAHRSS